MNLKAVLEGLFFVVGEDGLTLEQIKENLGVEEDKVKDLLHELKDDYENSDRGLRINILGNVYKVTTKEEHNVYYQKILTETSTMNLSQSALEILAIIVYNEPVTRVQVDNIRGVSSAQMIRKLVLKGFVKEIGRSDLPGRPILYKTTNEFLDYFGLSSKEDLPVISKEEEIEELETNLFLSKYQEE